MMDEAITKVILSQTMTTQDGSSLSQAQVHAGVKLEIVKADADLLSDSFNNGPARWWTDLNYGAEVAAPQLVRLVDEEADLKLMAETDEILMRTGWKRTEESFKDTYGDGFEKQKDALAAPVNTSGEAIPKDAALPGNDNSDDDTSIGAGKQVPDPKAASFAASDPRSLYVYRRLKNAKDVIAWARAQGFKSVMAGGDMHVTIAYSRQPVNWLNMGQSWTANAELIVPEGGARIVDKIGGEGAVALHFTNSDLEWRNKDMRDQGAGWDYSDYHPHVTLTYDVGGLDLSKVDPYLGKLVFGPEIFEPLDTQWQDDVSEISFAEPAVTKTDLVDEAAAELLKLHGYTPLTPAMQAVITALENSNSADEFDQALLGALPKPDADALTPILARAGFAVRIAAEQGFDA